MSKIAKLKQINSEMKSWRQYIHQHPETAFEEVGTSRYIFDKLTGFGLEVHQGLGKTGVVATLKTSDRNKKIALRAEIDALDIKEENILSYSSKNEGKMHACGHDGHSAMLLGAAKHLSETRNFSGTVYFIFQPAEEIKGGGKKMIEDGLFSLFAPDSVYAMHNIPGISAGQFAIKPGPIMASMDNFEIGLHGNGGHAALPKSESDLISAAVRIIDCLNFEIEKNFVSSDRGIVSFTSIHGGNSWNVFPTNLIVRGTLRCFNKEIRDNIIKIILPNVVSDIVGSHGIKFKIHINSESPGYPVTLNTEKESKIAQEVAIKLVGGNNVNTNPEPWAASEDFGFMLQEKPGCYIWIGNGPEKNYGMLHSPKYDFNDEILPVGAAFWVNLVEEILKKDNYSTKQY